MRPDDRRACAGAGPFPIEPHATRPLEKAFGYQGDTMNLPVPNLDLALPFYETVLGFRVTPRRDTPYRSATLARDAVQMALVESVGDPTQDGCAFHVSGLEALFAESQAKGLGMQRSSFDTERRDGAAFRVFHVVALDGLCYWFGERQWS